MSAGEVVHRVRDRGRQRYWAARQVRPGTELPATVPGLRPDRQFAATLPAGLERRVSPAAAASLLAAADSILAGEHPLLGVPRPDLADPDWFWDVVTGRRAPNDTYAFRIDHRDEGVTGNVKAVWELSRHHHLTVLAAAWWLTGEERYAAVAAAQLRSWWAANPFLSGINWTSGIEVGVRLTSWVWVRRLLDGWSGTVDLFEDNPAALHQLRWHQEYLAAFRSRGSSANNHAVAEAVGRFLAATAFPWFVESRAWRVDAATEVEKTLAANTFPSGVNRELASDYHRFVSELGLVALAEGDRAGHPLGDDTRRRLAASLDAAAALVDAAGRPPRQGDGDEGRALIIDDPEADAWSLVLGAGATVFGQLPWWPEVPESVIGNALGALARSSQVPGRPDVRPAAYEDAGICLLRTPAGHEPEIWCRLDGGPHGFLSIAAHAHADALSAEVRCDGVEVLVDPGTFCYHGDPEWRRYFRSTLAHNTVEVDGTNQSVEGGPFLWTTRTDATLSGPQGSGNLLTATASHHGYARLDPCLAHERTVELDLRATVLAFHDRLTASDSHTLRLLWHLGPEVEVELVDDEARLSWRTGLSGPGGAVLQLPPELGWTAHRGETDPVLGWYSPRFGQRVPCTTLVGAGAWQGGLRLTTLLRMLPTPTTAPDAGVLVEDLASGGGPP
jgi:hypothetical protein